MSARNLAIVLEHRDTEPTIDEFIEDHSLQTLACIVDLTPSYAAGRLTYRGVANATEISYGEAFQILPTIMPVLGCEPDPETLRPGDVDRNG